MADQFIQFPQGQESGVLTPSSIVSPDLPEEFGGRPVGGSRRAIRMQEEWDKRREQQLQEMQMAQQMELERKRFEIQARDQQLQEDDFFFRRNAAEAEQKLKAQQTAEAKEFLGVVNSLDPRSEDYRDSLIRLRRQYPLGSLDPQANAIIGEYDKVHSVYMDARKEDIRDMQAEEEFRVQQEATAAKLGIDTKEFVKDGDVDRVGLMRKIGEAQKEDLESKEEKIKQAKLDEETRSQAGQITKDMRELQDEIELKAMQADRMKGRVKEEAMIELEALNNRYARRVNELDELTLPKLTKEDKSAYEELPEGAEFFLDGRKVRKPKTQKTESAEPTATPQPTPEPEPVAEAPAPAATTTPRPEPTPETVASESMLRDMNDEDTLSAELDNLYKQGYKFSPNKSQRELYTRISQQLKEVRGSKNKQKFERAAEIRKRMNEIGAFNSNPTLREEYSRLQQEREVLLGA